MRVPCFRRIAFATLALALLFRPCLADAEELGFVALLNGQNQLPPIDTPATAVAHVVLDTETGRIRYEMQIFDIVTLLQVHIHLGGPTVNGPLIYSLSRSGANLVSGEQAFRPEDVDDLLTGGMYVNAHTFAHGEGEIRGQLLPGSLHAHLRTFRQPLGPDEVIPPVTGLDAGAASMLTLDLRLQGNRLVAGSPVFDLEYRFPGSVNLRGLHVHRGPPGASGPIVLDSGLTPITDTDGRGRLVLRVVLTSTQVLDLLGAMQDNPAEFYLDLHTSTHPEGALRGQLDRLPATPLICPSPPGRP